MAAAKRPLLYVWGPLSPLLRSDEGKCFQDPTSPATFSRVHVESERPLSPVVERRAPLGIPTTTRITPATATLISRRYNGVS